MLLSLSAYVYWTVRVVEYIIIIPAVLTSRDSSSFTFSKDSLTVNSGMGNGRLAKMVSRHKTGFANCNRFQLLFCMLPMAKSERTRAKKSKMLKKHVVYHFIGYNRPAYI